MSRKDRRRVVMIDLTPALLRAVRAVRARAAARRGLFNLVQRLTPQGLALLAEAGLLRQAPFDPAALTRATFPGVELDFGIEACDARLRANAPDFYRRNGL